MTNIIVCTILLCYCWILKNGFWFARRSIKSIRWWFVVCFFEIISSHKFGWFFCYPCVHFFKLSAVLTAFSAVRPPNPGSHVVFGPLCWQQSYSRNSLWLFATTCVWCWANAASFIVVLIECHFYAGGFLDVFYSQHFWAFTYFY